MKWLIRFAFVLSIFFPINRLWSQEGSLKVGDYCPDIIVKKIINFPVSSGRLYEITDKAVILDFWATWCVPCLQAFPKLAELQKKYEKDVLILPVTTQDQSTVLQLQQTLTNKIPLFSSVIEDSVLSKKFPYSRLPHYVWIDKNKIVKAITGSKEINEINIEKLISGQKLPLSIKQDFVSHDPRKPIFAGMQRELGNEVLFQSLFTSYRPDLPNGSYSGKNFIDLPNHSIIRIYQLVFGRFSFEFMDYKRVILEGASSLEDSLKLGMFNAVTKQKWKDSFNDNVYTYEIFSNDSTVSRDELFSFAQEDVNRFFTTRGISGNIERRKVKYYSLQRISDKDRIGTKGSNEKDIHTDNSIIISNLPISRFISKFQGYATCFGNYPVYDDTHYLGNVDISISCDLTSLSAINKQLERYNLKFNEVEGDIDMLVITMK